MNTTKKLMTLLLVMLALMGCKDSKDAPTPDGQIEGDVYVLVGSYDRDFVYNLDGDAIYSSPEGSHIASLPCVTATASSSWNEDASSNEALTTNYWPSRANITNSIPVAKSPNPSPCENTYRPLA